MRFAWISLSILLPLLAPTQGEARENPPERPPNIVFILADDLGYPYHGFTGNEIVRTPNLDRLAAEGTTFTRAFSPASVCRPALQTLLSGLHPRSWRAQRTRLEEAMGERFLRRTEVEQYVTLPRQLARKGYRTFQGGKHWEGDFRSAGFDAGTTDVVPFSRFPLDWLHFARVSQATLTDFLDDAGEEEPFFVYFAPMLPHQPHNPPIRFLSLYRGDNLVSRAARYYANISWFDDVVGRMLAALETRGLRENTLIIYVSDNGWEQGPDDIPRASTRKLGGDRGKLSIFELGFRSPLVFNWPGRVPANEERDDLVTFRDLHATILQYAGAPLPPDHEGLPLNRRITGHGEPARNHITGFQNLLRARESEYTPTSVLSVEDAGFLRTDRWRYVEWLDRGEQALFEIEQDPFERNNVASDHPELLSKFAEQTAAWRDTLDQPAAWIDLVGRLTAEDETPAPGLRLWLESTLSSTRLEVFADDRGFFRFPNVPADEYTLTYEIEPPTGDGRWKRARRAGATQSRPIDLTGYETSPYLALRIPGRAPPAALRKRASGAIEIEVLAGRSIATSGLPIRLRGWTTRGYVEQRVLSGPDGFVAIDELPTGIYIVKVQGTREVPSRSRLVFLGQGTTESLIVELQKKTRRYSRKAKSKWKSKPSSKSQSKPIQK